jgi:SAM-dependent methyltransferase
MSNIDKMTCEEIEKSRAAWWGEDFTRTLLACCSLWHVTGIFDAGCGTGTLYERLRPYLPLSAGYTGIDIDADRIKRARELYEHYGNAVFETASIYDLKQYAGMFDVAFSLMTFQHLGDPVQGMKELLGVIKPGGKIISVEPLNSEQVLLGSQKGGVSADHYRKLFREIEKRIKPGDSNIGRRMPDIMSCCGLNNLEVRVYPITICQPWCLLKPQLLSTIELVSKQFDIDSKDTEELKAIIEQSVDSEHGLWITPLVITAGTKE